MPARGHATVINGYLAMKSFLPCFWLLLMTPLLPDPAAGAERLLTDFTPSTPDLGWYVVNDNVMGGRSDGGFELQGGELFFTGRTNTRGGGFSSIRSGMLALDLSSHDGIRVRVKGDGRRYTWRLTTGARVYGREVAYWADFDTTGNTWETIDIPFSSFVPRFRGAVLDGPPLETGDITGMGLMIYDKRDGPFAMQLQSIHAYANEPAVSLDQWRWDKRVLVISAPGVDDPSFRSQLEALEGTRAEFSDRDMFLVTLLDDERSMAGDRPLTREAVARVRAELGIGGGNFAVRLIGKDGGTKLSQDAVVSMDEIYALIDRMPMRRREMRDPG